MVRDFVAIGLSAGVLSGMFGIGGGILIVPALILLANFPAKMALGTSLGALLLPVGLLGRVHLLSGRQSQPPGLAPGCAGSLLRRLDRSQDGPALPAATLQRMFAIFIVLMAVRLWIEAGKA